METTTPKTAEKATLTLTKPLSAAPVESTQATTPFGDTVDRTAHDATATVESRAPLTSRFPARARDAGREGQTNLGIKIEGFFSSRDWAESARNAVRAHPLAVVGVALVAGLLVGRL